MHKKWAMKAGALILALSFISACNTTDDKNKNDNVPQDTNAPAEEDPNFENTRYNNQNTNTPNTNEREFNIHDDHDGIQRKSKW